MMQAPVELATLPPIGAKSETGRGRALTFPLSRLWLIILCGGSIMVLGYLDYLTGYEQSLLLFYLVPIAIATWFGGLVFGLVMSLISVAAWVASDIFAGIATVGFWNLGMALSAYIVF